MIARNAHHSRNSFRLPVVVIVGGLLLLQFPTTLLTPDNAARLTEVAVVELEEPALDAVWSPGGETILAAQTGHVAVFNEFLRAPRELELLERDVEAYVLHSLDYSLQANALAAGSATGTLHLWDMGAGAPLPGFPAHDDLTVNAVDFDADGARVLTAGDDALARVWTLGGRQDPVLLEGHVSAVLTAAFSPDGSRVATGAQGGDAVTDTLRLWESVTGEEIPTTPELETTFSLAFSPGGDLLLYGGDEGVFSLNVDMPEAEPSVFAATDDPVRSLAFSLDGALVATGDAGGTVRVWDAATGAELATLDGHEGVVWSVAFNPAQTALLTAGEDGTVRVWGIAP